jgi:signal transduction histidine kinase
VTSRLRPRGGQEGAHAERLRRDRRAARASAIAGSAGRRPRLRHLLAGLFVVAGFLVAAAGVAAGVSLDNQVSARRHLVDRIDPATAAAATLLEGYVQQLTALRGYALSGDRELLAGFRAAQRSVETSSAQLRSLLPAGSGPAAAFSAASRAGSAWESSYAQPSAAEGPPAGAARLSAGSAAFARLRSDISRLQALLASERLAAQGHLNASFEELVAVLAASLAVVVLAGAVIWVALRRLVAGPVASVAADALVVAGGDLDHAVEPAGPREVAELASAIEAMRLRIVSEVSQTRALNDELARSNEELEQFAYVASHDLQEPLRKVTSFCQLLAQRYGGQLDERGEQYIAFAVDGAKRMQGLINDLLAFSRIGRTTDHFEAVDLAECTDIAVRNLSMAVEQEAAEVRVEGVLPTVMGDRSLLVALMQNLVANAVKFRGEAPPQVTVRAEAGEDDWTVSVSDNGIGVEPRFAERIFVIFQRLHSREAYAGTGIGLAMCRKIVEFHGGRIWLDTGYGPGARFCFSLPKVPTEEPADERDDLTVDAG